MQIKMGSDNVYMCMIYPNDISTRIESYLESDKTIFVRKMKKLLLGCELARGRKNKADFVLKIIDLLEEHSQMIFYPKNISDWFKFRITVKNKFKELLVEKEVKEECQKFLDKYFDERCRAYTRWGIRCKNRAKKEVSKNFCGVHHKKFVPKLFSIIETELAHVEAQICVSLLF